MFVSAIIIIDTFFVSYYLGVHSRTVEVEDTSIKAVQTEIEKAKDVSKSDAKADVKKESTVSGKGTAKTGEKGALKAYSTATAKDAKSGASHTKHAQSGNKKATKHHD